MRVWVGASEAEGEAEVEAEEEKERIDEVDARAAMLRVLVVGGG